MGLLTGGLSFRRYRVYSSLPDDFRDQFLTAIDENHFRENLSARTKDPVFGWVSVSNPDDTSFDLNKVLFDRYLVLGMRVDKKSVNSKLFNILLQRRFSEVMAEQASDRLSKNHKEEIKEALEEELLSKTLPSVATYDLAWDIHSGEALVFATSESVLDLIQGIFHDSFTTGLYAERLVDWLATDWDWESLRALIDTRIPGGAAETARGLNEDGRYEGNLLAGRELQLGSEFLSWLWHESETHDGYFKISYPARGREGLTRQASITERDLSEENEAEEGESPEASAADTGTDATKAAATDSADQESTTPTGAAAGADREVDEITVWLDNKLIFRDMEDVDHPGVTTMVGAAPSTTHEAKISMSSGKRPVEARIGMQRGELEWFFTLRVGPGGLELHGLKLPIEVKDGDEEKIYERMFLLELLSNAVQGLFRRFFAVRTSEDWDGLIEGWIEAD